MELENVKHDIVAKEFLAVVLAGFGDGLVPLTSDYGDEPCPKALLPVANKPLIGYVLAWLEHSGIKDVLLVCPTRHRSSIYHHIHSDISSSSLRIDLQTFDDNENSGTSALLRQFSARITEDFIIVPVDFIPPPTLPLSILLDKFRVEASSEACIAISCWYPTGAPEKGSLIEEWGPPAGRFAIVWDPHTGTLLQIDTPDDQDKNPDSIELRMSMLSRFPRTHLSSSYEDSHVYVCKRALLELLNEKGHFSSFREEFLPWLCKLQYRYSHPPSSKVGIVIHNQPDTAIRINTLQNFYEANRARILTDSIIGESTQIGERTSVKKSVIGRHCVIGKVVKISNCILLDHCVIGDGAKIETCILGKSTQVGPKAELTRCVTQAGFEVGAGENVKGEKLEVSNWMANPEEMDEITD